MFFFLLLMVQKMDPTEVLSSVSPSAAQSFFTNRLSSVYVDNLVLRQAVS